MTTTTPKQPLIVTIAADEAGFALKTKLKPFLARHPLVAQLQDVGIVSASDKSAYPWIISLAAGHMRDGQADRVLLISGTGLAMAMGANKMPNVRAVAAHDSQSIEEAVVVHDARVLCLGAEIIGIRKAKSLVSEWLEHRCAATPEHVANIRLMERLGRERLFQGLTMTCTWGPPRSEPIDSGSGG